MLAQEVNLNAPKGATAALGEVGSIRALNDAFRIDPRQGRVVMTPEVASLPPADLTGLITAIQTFDDFTTDNDPYGEHDVGAVIIGGDRYFWKIDYYDNSLEYGSPDPADPAVTRRVMTIMRSDEY